MKYTVNATKQVAYVSVADLQDHKAELTVLILVQLMNQLPVVSLPQKTRVQRQQRRGEGTSLMYPISAEKNIVVAFTSHKEQTVDGHYTMDIHFFYHANSVTKVATIKTQTH